LELPQKQMYASVIEINLVSVEIDPQAALFIHLPLRFQHTERRSCSGLSVGPTLAGMFAHPNYFRRLTWLGNESNAEPLRRSRHNQVVRERLHVIRYLFVTTG